MGHDDDDDSQRDVLPEGAVGSPETLEKKADQRSPIPRAQTSRSNLDQELVENESLEGGGGMGRGEN